MRIFRWMNDNKSHLQELASVDDQSELLEMVWTCENVDEMRAPIRSDMTVVNKVTRLEVDPDEHEIMQ